MHMYACCRYMMQKFAYTYLQQRFAHIHMHFHMHIHICYSCQGPLLDCLPRMGDWKNMDDKEWPTRQWIWKRRGHFFLSLNTICRMNIVMLRRNVYASNRVWLFQNSVQGRAQFAGWAMSIMIIRRYAYATDRVWLFQNTFAGWASW